MSEIGAFMQIIERIEVKVDDIRDRLHDTIVMTNVNQIRQASHDQEIKDLKAEVAELKTAYDKASGVWRILSLPGILSAIYATFQLLGK
jgi:hypothetical protein